MSAQKPPHLRFGHAHGSQATAKPPDARRSVEAAPTHLGPSGRELWDQVVEALGGVAKTERPQLLLLCEVADTRRAAQDALELMPERLLFTSTGYRYSNPLIAQVTAAERQMAGLMTTLGLGAAAQAEPVEVKPPTALESIRARSARNRAQSEQAERRAGSNGR